ncbi:cyanophycinase [Cytobacillus depressus]|uniref:Cyanophycinase n=1 Tax=Cytobacillus depressus TaxID=1602942 RepID=A0A6L3V4Y8_9BACI|nr:cyanophycinase [Cytobacillus depressus]
MNKKLEGLRLRKLSIICVLVLTIFAITISSFDVEAAENNKNVSKNAGSLVIVGGALDSDNEAVYMKYLTLAQQYKGKSLKDVKIAIIPAASAEPIGSANAYKEDFIQYGVPAENVYTAPIAVIDDPSTKDVDESTWKNNGNSAEIAKKIEEVDAIWFVGGDQLRHVKTLVTPDGKDTVVLNAIRKIYENGAVLGGSSAGAAIMSNPMIANGTSVSALTEGVHLLKNFDQEVDNDQLFLTTGFGFFPHGIVDQHFLQRGRFGRLLVATQYNKTRYGFGIDENSAMVYYGADDSIEVVGESGLLIVDLQEAKTPKSKRFAMNNVTMHYLEKGDRFNVTAGTFELNKKHETTKGIEYYSKNPMATDIFGAQKLKKVLTEDLIDNEAKKAEAIWFDMEDDKKGIGFKFTFRKTNKTEGFWGRIDKVGSYAALNVQMDVEPITIKIQLDK